MKCSLFAEVKCFLTFTDDQWALIINACKHHYDYDLKISVEYGGWLYGLNNQRVLSENKQNCELEFTFRQIDKILKALEMEFVATSNDDVRIKLAFELDKQLRNVITMLSAAYIAANLVLKPLTVDNV